jgi:hypothetical protein
MNILTLLIASTILMALAAFVLPSLVTGPRRKALASLFSGFWLTSAANTYDAAVETHESKVRRTNDAAVTARHLLWTKGAGDNTVALCSATTCPLGTIDNTETSTGMGQTVWLLGKGHTKKAVASGAIAVGNAVYTDAGGKVTATPVKNCWYIGQALTATAADNDLLELDDCTPIQIKSSHVIFAAGLYTWAGGAATTAAITATGALTTDVAVATLAARASTETLVLAITATDAVNLTLGANGTNGTTKVGYVIYRPVS